MLKNFKVWTFFLALSLLLTGCEFKDLTLERVDSFSIEELTKEGMQGTISLVITNPNSFSINVNSASFDIYSGSVKVGNADLSKSFKIKGNTTETYPVQLSGNMSNLIAGGLSSLIGAIRGQNPRVNIKGELKASAFLFSKTIPVDVTTEVPLDSFNR